MACKVFFCRKCKYKKKDAFLLKSGEATLWAVYTCTKDIYIFLFVFIINRRMQNPRR